jgi:3-isopropylmalate/(R)-2-methylmalate dehydratase small subunit
LEEAAACTLVSYAPWRLLESLDDIGLTLRHEDEIADFEQRRGEHLPSVTGSGSS